MECVPYRNGILFRNRGEGLRAKHELYAVQLRGREKRLNGHFLINYGGENESAGKTAGHRKSNSMKGDDDDEQGCGIGYFLRNKEMDYLCDEALGLKIYTSTRTLAITAKMGLRGFLDAVCILCPPRAFRKMLPFAQQILDILQSFPQLQAILPTVGELRVKVPFSRFLVGAVATYHHYYRGPKGTIYNPTQANIIPWNLDQDTLPEASRLEWLRENDDDEQGSDEEDDEQGSDDEPPQKKNRPPQKTTDRLAAAVWLRENYRIQANSRITKGDVYQDYRSTCAQTELLPANRFGELFNEIFEDIEDEMGRVNGKTTKFYTNLLKLGLMLLMLFL